MTFDSSHPISFTETFNLREPVLKAILGSTRWSVTPDGKNLLLDLPLGNYSTHERHIIEFSLNPYETASGIFGGLDKPVAHSLAAAIEALFGADGYYR